MIRQLALFAFLAFSAPALAGGLTVEIVAPDGSSVEHDIDALERMGMQSLSTSTTWTDGAQEFSGVLLSTIAEDLGVTGGTAVVSAINEYHAEIPVEELLRYPVLLATRQNGERMPVRDKGPAWVVYPRDQFPELSGEDHNFKWVWQVKSVRFR